MGFADRLECLTPPGRCIPGFPDAPSFLDTRFAQPTRHGYRFRFDPGTAAPPAEGPFSASSLIWWAYVAEPITIGETGVRAFCVDASAFVCASSDGRIGRTDGKCPATCQRLY